MRKALISIETHGRFPAPPRRSSPVRPRPRPVGLTYWTDGAHLSATGTETIILGPGDIALAHGPDDAVPISELTQTAQLYADLSHRLLG